MRRVLLLIILLAFGSVAVAQTGDKVHFGQSIVLHEGETADNVVCFGCAVQVQGDVKQNVVVFFGDAAVSGNVEQNTVVFLGDVHLFSGAHIGQNAVVFAGRLEATPDATVGQNRVVFPSVILLIPVLIFCVLIMAIVTLIRFIAHRRQPQAYTPARQ